MFKCIARIATNFYQIKARNYQRFRFLVSYDEYVAMFKVFQKFSIFKNYSRTIKQNVGLRMILIVKRLHFNKKNFFFIIYTEFRSAFLTFLDSDRSEECTFDSVDEWRIVLYLFIFLWSVEKVVNIRCRKKNGAACCWHLTNFIIWSPTCHAYTSFSKKKKKSTISRLTRTTYVYYLQKKKTL